MAEWEESMSTRGRESGESETPSVDCEVAAIAHEQSEYVTAVEGGMLSSCTTSAEERRAYGVWLKQLQSRCGSEEEFNTARSIWTQVAGTSEGMSPAEEKMCVSENQRFFQDLISKLPPPPDIETFPISEYWSWFNNLLETWPFFADFRGRLELGKKIGEGGQAEIYEALFDGRMPFMWHHDILHLGYVLKVFRLKHSHWFRHAWAKESKSIHMQSIKEGPDSLRYSSELHDIERRAICSGDGEIFGRPSQSH